MGIRDWFHSSGDEEYSSQTGDHSASSSTDASGPRFQGSFRSSVTRCEPDETGQTRCRRYVTHRTRNGPDSQWSEERTDEELPYEEVGFQVPGMNEMMEDVNRIMDEFGSMMGGFRFPLFPGWDHEEQHPPRYQAYPQEQQFPFSQPRNSPWSRRPPPTNPGYGGSDDVYDA